MFLNLSARRAKRAVEAMPAKSTIAEITLQHSLSQGTPSRGRSHSNAPKLEFLTRLGFEVRSTVLSRLHLEPRLPCALRPAIAHSSLEESLLLGSSKLGKQSRQTLW